MDSAGTVRGQNTCILCDIYDGNELEDENSLDDEYRLDVRSVVMDDRSYI